MNCKKFQAKIEEYLSGKLPPAVKEEFELHSSTCNNCQKHLLAYKAIHHTIESLRNSYKSEPSETDIPYGLRENILANIRAISEKPIPLYLRVRWIRLCVVTAASILLMVSVAHFDLLRKRFFPKSIQKISQPYNLNNFVADAIAEAKMRSESEIAITKTSEFIGLKE